MCLLLKLIWTFFLNELFHYIEINIVSNHFDYWLILCLCVCAHARAYVVRDLAVICQNLCWLMAIFFIINGYFCCHDASKVGGTLLQWNLGREEAVGLESSKRFGSFTTSWGQKEERGIDRAACQSKEVAECLVLRKHNKGRCHLPPHYEAFS